MDLWELHILTKSVLTGSAARSHSRVTLASFHHSRRAVPKTRAGDTRSMKSGSARGVLLQHPRACTGRNTLRTCPQWGGGPELEL